MNNKEQLLKEIEDIPEGKIQEVIFRTLYKNERQGSEYGYSANK